MAVTTVEMPPRGRKSPLTMAHCGSVAFTTSFNIWLTAFSLKDAQAAVVEQIFLQRLELQAILARHVADGQQAEVGQAGFGADAGELGVVDQDLVAGKLVFPDVDRRERIVEPGGRVGVGIAGILGAHHTILPASAKMHHQPDGRRAQRIVVAVGAERIEAAVAELDGAQVERRKQADLESGVDVVLEVIDERRLAVRAQ